MNQPLIVVLYTRSGCHLCENAKELVQKYMTRFRIQLKEVDIDGDPELRQKYDCCVPVLEIAGKVRFHGQINEALLVRQLKIDSAAH